MEFPVLSFSLKAELKGGLTVSLPLASSSSSSDSTVYLMELIKLLSLS